MSTLEPIQKRPISLSEHVYDSIRDAIISRRLAPGDRVTEAKLASELKVSKTPVREALLRLEYIGLIEADGIRGGRIVVPSLQSIRYAYETRTGVECQGARIIAENGDGDDIVKIQNFADLCLEAAMNSDRQGFREFDRKFHLAMADATRNPLLSKLIHDAFDLTSILRQRDVPAASDVLTCARQHVDVAVAIGKGDVDGADRAMRTHLNQVQSLIFAAAE